MDFTLRNDSMVKVYNDTHGLFTMDGDKFIARISNIISSVNYDRKAFRALQAAVTEATDFNYFDCDLAMLAAATLECNFDDFTINYIMADSDDELWVNDVEKRFAPMRAM